VSTGFTDESDDRDPGLEHLIKALTADGEPSELAARDAAAAMFDAAFGACRARPRRRPRLPLQSIRAGVAAAVIAAVAGSTAAAYAAVLPTSVQHIAHSVFAPLGVPDRRPHAASGASRGPVPGGPSAASADAPTGSRSPRIPPSTSRQAPPGNSLTLTAASAQVPTGGRLLLEGGSTDHGAPRPGIRVRLFKRTAGQPGWRLTGSAVTGPGGRVVFTVPYLVANTAFYLATAGGAPSAPVTVTVIPHVVLRAVAGQQGTDLLRASAPFGDPGDAVTLQELSGGTWIDVASRVLDTGHQAIFTVSAGEEFRAMLDATGRHAAGISDEVSAPRSSTRSGSSSSRTGE
jgi:hypothetical protein